MATNANDWLRIANGDSQYKELEDVILLNFKRAFDLWQIKQLKYGPANVALAGVSGVRGRMQDKMARWERMEGQGFEGTTDESFADTLIDLVNYPAMALAVYEGNWPTVEELGLTPKSELDNAIARLAGLMEVDPDELTRTLIIRFG